MHFDKHSCLRLVVNLLYRSLELVYGEQHFVSISYLFSIDSFKTLRVEKLFDEIDDSASFSPTVVYNLFAFSFSCCCKSSASCKHFMLTFILNQIQLLWFKERSHNFFGCRNIVIYWNIYMFDAVMDKRSKYLRTWKATWFRSAIKWEHFNVLF